MRRRWWLTATFVGDDYGTITFYRQLHGHSAWKLETHVLLSRGRHERYRYRLVVEYSDGMASETTEQQPTRPPPLAQLLLTRR